ncbi:class F sortase [Candidatus Saccharibacteria bacterium]|nr:class F sortase [Candidatus Saccharibacteria bacterium]
MSSARISLDNPVFAGRFRDLGRGSHYLKPKQRSIPKNIDDIKVRPSRQIVKVQPAVYRQAKSQVLQRNTTARLKSMHKSNKHRSLTKPIGQKLMVVMASLVFIAGLAVSGLGLLTNRKVISQVKAATQKSEETSNGGIVEETKPTDQQMAAYQVDPMAPRYVRIAKINVFGRVQKQGVDASGNLKAPGNVHDVGWYQNSSRPGEAGAMLLDGHVSGPTAKGVFYNIKNLVAGDELEVERGDGQKFTYKVVKSETTKAVDVDMANALTSAESSKPGLNLITCTGKFDSTTGQYEDRIIVYAVQV